MDKKVEKVITNILENTGFNELTTEQMYAVLNRVRNGVNEVHHKKVSDRIDKYLEDIKQIRIKEQKQ